jgi:hypothetical protein
MRSRRLIVATLLTIPGALSACSPVPARPPAGATTPTLTRKQAYDALKAMLRAHPDAFRQASTTIRPEESRRFIVVLYPPTYRVEVWSGRCSFEYTGRFTSRGGSWAATEPELASISECFK